MRFKRKSNLVPLTASSAATSVTTPLHLDFLGEGIESAVERAISAGARVEPPIATHKWGKLVLMADPFGHCFCFVPSPVAR